jgi:hypothetical protein
MRMTIEETALKSSATRHQIDVADLTLNFRPVYIDDLTPTGAQLAAAAGFKSPEGVTVMQFLGNGELEDIRPTETVDLRHAEGRFVIVESDRSYRWAIDRERFDWPARVVSGGAVRKLGNVPADKAIYLERREEPDRLIEDQTLIDLDAPGVESFISRKRIWKFNVQGVLLELTEPTIVARAAIELAGLDPDRGWHIFVKVVGEKKRPVELTTVIDLRTPGIEKLRLTPKDVNNGEALVHRRMFALLDADEAYLDRLGLKWETIVEKERRWLLIHDYLLPAGYTVATTMLALEIPTDYPGSQIYGFYAYPPLALVSAREIDRTQMRGTLLGVEFHGWSRYRPSEPWDPAKDNVVTQLALVDAALAKEVGE